MCVPTSNSCLLIGYNCKKCLDCKKSNNFCLTVSIISNLYDYMSTRCTATTLQKFKCIERSNKFYSNEIQCFQYKSNNWRENS